MKMIAFIITLIFFILLQVYAFLVPDWLSNTIIVLCIVIAIVAFIRLIYIIVKK